MPFDKPQPAKVVIPVMAVGPFVLVTCNVLVNEQILASVTFNVYTILAEAETKEGVIPPLLQLYVYGVVPPLTVTVPEPVGFVKLQVAGVRVDVNVNEVG